MRLPRVRFTVRRLMVAVALAGLLAAGFADYLRRHERISRHQRLINLARWHRIEADRPEYSGTPMAEYHMQLAEKYLAAFQHPWLPVAPDPPEPR